MLRPRASCRTSGKALPLLDAPAYVTGKAVFGADVKLPGMLTAVIARPPGGRRQGRALRRQARARGAWRASRDRDAASRSRRTCSSRGAAIAVVADHTWAAMRGRAALDVDVGPRARTRPTTPNATRAARKSVALPGERGAQGRRSPRPRSKSAARVVEAEYHVPHLPHLPMEPPVAVARVDGDALRGLGADAEPAGRADEVARALGTTGRQGHACT